MADDRATVIRTCGVLIKNQYAGSCKKLQYF